MRETWIFYDGQCWTRAELDAHRAHEAAKKRSNVVQDYVRAKRGRYVLRGEGDDRKVVDLLEAPLARPSKRTQVIRDLEPYQAIGLPGAPWITGGRAEHRAMLKRYGKIEVGNEWNSAHKDMRRREPTVPSYTPKQHLADLVYGRRPLKP